MWSLPTLPVGLGRDDPAAREQQFARYLTWVGTRASYPSRWQGAGDDSGYVFYLTVEELEQLSGELPAGALVNFAFNGVIFAIVLAMRQHGTSTMVIGLVLGAVAAPRLQRRMRLRTVTTVTALAGALPATAQG
jgi:hypothetical protein